MLCPELCGCKVQEQKGKAIFILLLIMAVVYFIGYLCTCCFNQVTSARLALQQADGWALPGLALVQLGLCLLLFGQPCLALPRRKFGIALPALLCACAVHPQKLQTPTSLVLDADPSLGMQRSIAASPSRHPRHPGALLEDRSLLSKANRPGKAADICSESGKGPSLWCVSLSPR